MINVLSEYTLCNPYSPSSLQASFWCPTLRGLSKIMLWQWLNRETTCHLPWSCCDGKRRHMSGCDGPARRERCYDCVIVHGDEIWLREWCADHSAAIKCGTVANSGGTFISLQWWNESWQNTSRHDCTEAKNSARIYRHVFQPQGLLSSVKQVFCWIHFFRTARLFGPLRNPHWARKIGRDCNKATPTDFHFSNDALIANTQQTASILIKVFIQSLKN